MYRSTTVSFYDRIVNIMAFDDSILLQQNVWLREKISPTQKHRAKEIIDITATEEREFYYNFVVALNFAAANGKCNVCFLVERKIKNWKFCALWERRRLVCREVACCILSIRNIKKNHFDILSAVCLAQIENNTQTHSALKSIYTHNKIIFTTSECYYNKQNNLQYVRRDNLKREQIESEIELTNNNEQFT